jgi:two-component system sensor histidine kinase BaeS
MKFKLTFRSRLLITHILPVALLVPLVGLALIYLLETRLILPTLANEMIDQGMLVKRLTLDRPNLWNSPSAAQGLLDSIDFRRPTSIGLLTPVHVLLATSRLDDRLLVGKTIPNIPDVKTLGDSWWSITSGDLPGEQILDVVVPVKQPGGETAGLVRIYRRITDIERSFSTMRYLILGVLLMGLLITGGIAVFLSESISRPLRAFTRTIENSPLEGQTPRMPEDHDSELFYLSQAYNRLQDRRLELEESRQQMLANLIHEIGRPLGSLRTALHALQAGAVEDQDLRFDLMKGMSERIDRMGRLLEDLALTYHSLEPQEIQTQSVQINEWLESLIPIWAESARQKRLGWEQSVPDDLPIIQTDPDRLAQALGNLVNNAIKFTPQGGRITLEVLEEDDRVIFRVVDTGIGISSEDQQHLFKPFFRGIQPSWKAPGLGLGLSITGSIIESLGGKITLNSQPGQGSTFSITIRV